MSGDASSKMTWTAIFSRKGGSGARTRLWDDWDTETRADVLHSVHLDDNELPVLLARPSAGLQFLLTTRRLIYGSVTAAVNDIVEIKPVQFTEKRKDQLDELSVGLTSGKAFQIAVEIGPSYVALWNTLLHISKHNARRRLAS